MIKKSIIHIYLYGLLKREVQGGNIIHISKIHPIIKWVVRVPRQYQRGVIAELIDCGLLKKRDRDNYELITYKIKKPPIDSLGEPLW